MREIKHGLWVKAMPDGTFRVVEITEFSRSKTWPTEYSTFGKAARAIDNERYNRAAAEQGLPTLNRWRKILRWVTQPLYK